MSDTSTPTGPSAKRPRLHHSTSAPKRPRHNDWTSAPEQGVRFPMWRLLPPEIKQMVLKVFEDASGLPDHQLAILASVCKEWQAFFERINFRTLKIEDCVSELRDLELYVRGSRRKLLKEIEYIVPLAVHFCRLCDQGDCHVVPNEMDFDNAVRSLLQILSRWESSPDHQISLRISAGRLSDGVYSMLDSDEPVHYTPYHLEHSLFRNLPLAVPHPPRNYRRWSTAVFLWRYLALRPELSQEYDLDWEELEEVRVPIIRKLSVDQQSYRSLSAAGLETLLESLPRLQCINYEPWRASGLTPPQVYVAEVARDRASQSLFENLPAQTTGLSLWEAQDERFFPHYLRTKQRNRDLARAGLEASYRLSKLAVSMAIDAEDFFQPYDPEQTRPGGAISSRSWPNLEYLALTSGVLTRSDRPADINQLLLAASKAAARMPRLKIMELWNWFMGHGFVFRYQTIDGTPEDAAYGDTRLVIEATWGFSLDEKVLRSWKRVASQHTRHELVQTFQSLDSPVQSRDLVCWRLHLRELLQEWREDPEE